jgi:hypothetical protein
VSLRSEVRHDEGDDRRQNERRADPSRNDQPNRSTGRLGAIAVVNEPQPYTTQPIANARFGPMIAPTFASVIMSAAITSV